MIVRDDQLDAIQAASDQAVEESAPMHLSLGQCDRHPQHPAMAALGCVIPTVTSTAQSTSWPASRTRS